MTTVKKHAPRRPAVSAAAAVLGTLALAGCAATHVGDSWQCPLAQGKVCASVAAADPAVPAPAAGAPVLPEPLYRTWNMGGAGAAGMPPAPERPCDAACGGFDPLAWLAALFGADGEDDGGSRDGMPMAADTAVMAEAAKPPPEPSPSGSRTGDAAPVSPDIAAVEAGALAARPGPGIGGLRTGEVVARIWIAPFVDAGGIYREASHVRVVLEPAGWRLP